MPPKSNDKSEKNIEEAVQRAVKEALQDASWLQVLSNIVRDVVVAELKETINKNNEVISEMKKSLIEKDKQICELEAKIDDQEQYQRRQCLRLFGVKEEEGEDTDAISMQIAEKIGVELNVADIDRSHRVGRRDTDRPRPIIIKFVSYRKRGEIFRKKKNLKGSGMVLREDLSRMRHNLLKEAIAKFGLHNVWTNDGDIIVNHGGAKKRLTRMTDLRNM